MKSAPVSSPLSSNTEACGAVTETPLSLVYGSVLTGDEPTSGTATFVTFRRADQRHQVRVATDGTFSIAGLEGGSWSGVAAALGFVDSTREIEVAGDRQRVDFELERSALVRVKVLRPSGEPLEAGSHWRALSVVARREDPGAALPPTGLASDADGWALVEDKLPGEMVVRVDAPGFATYEDRVVLPPGEVLELGTIALARPVPIEIRVKGPDGAPAVEVGPSLSRFPLLPARPERELRRRRPAARRRRRRRTSHELPARPLPGAVRALVPLWPRFRRAGVDGRAARRRHERRCGAGRRARGRAGDPRPRRVRRELAGRALPRVHRLGAAAALGQVPRLAADRAEPRPGRVRPASPPGRRGSRGRCASQSRPGPSGSRSVPDPGARAGRIQRGPTRRPVTSRGARGTPRAGRGRSRPPGSCPRSCRSRTARSSGRGHRSSARSPRGSGA